MTTIRTLDLEYFGSGTIAAYLVESAGQLALVDTGPDSTYPKLVAALARLGARPADVGDVLLTHIHLDHAGAAFRLAREGARVHVHPRGAGHLADPAKLLASATRVYREKMESLWGALEPIAADRIRVTDDGETIRVGSASIRVLETPGHAVHHNAYLVDGCAFTGDVGGVALQGGPVLPPTPPPDIDLPAWDASIARLRDARLDAVCPTHFGRHGDVERYLDALGTELHAWADWVRARLAEGQDAAAMTPAFEAWAEERLVATGAPPELVAGYRVALPFAMNVNGLVRYWQRTAAA